MNRLNKIILSFVLPFFCLLISVSYAEFTSNSVSIIFGTSSSIDISSKLLSTDYTYETAYTVIENHFNDLSNSSYTEAFENLVSVLSSINYNLTVVEKPESSAYMNFGVILTEKTMEVGYCPSITMLYLSATGKAECFEYPSSTNKYGMSRYVYNITDTSKCGASSFHANSILYSSQGKVKTLTKSSNAVFWDGESYSYESVEPDEPDTPSLPSNAEIAQAVQAFYNSDYYKNNKDFEDFLVLYNTKTGYFSFLGHNFGNKLGQQIIDPDVSVGSPPVSYNQRWWRFYLVGLSEFTSTLFNKYYWLYGTSDFGENFEYQGKGSINDLLDVHFATASTIIYSTTDYPVTIMTADGAQADIIPGDQYTYDENLDPTTNEYNPLENFVPTSPSQSILGDVDFNEINRVFEENKDILNIENASWLFSANNQLVSYFLGFLLLLIVFLIISRVLGG